MGRGSLYLCETGFLWLSSASFALATAESVNLDVFLRL